MMQKELKQTELKQPPDPASATEMVNAVGQQHRATRAPTPAQKDKESWMTEHARRNG